MVGMAGTGFASYYAIRERTIEIHADVETTKRDISSLVEDSKRREATIQDLNRQMGEAGGRAAATEKAVDNLTDIMNRRIADILQEDEHRRSLREDRDAQQRRR